MIQVVYQAGESVPCSSPAEAGQDLAGRPGGTGVRPDPLSVNQRTDLARIV